MGDGGALMTNNAALAERIRMIANHGQQKKYYHQMVGCNSRLDTIQAAVLNVKIKYLQQFLASRTKVGTFYMEALKNFKYGELPVASPNSSQTYNQFTIRIKNGLRDKLKLFLHANGIPSMIYYPLPLYRQHAYSRFVQTDFFLPATELLCASVLSIPIHTEMAEEEMVYIADSILSFSV